MFDRKWRPWTQQRHDTEGRDVTDLPGLWHESDSLVRILAPESTWREPVEWAASYDRIRHLHYGTPKFAELKPPRILVDCDLFAPFDGQWVAEGGSRMLRCACCGSGSCERYNWAEKIECGCAAPLKVKAVETADFLARVFGVIDSTPNCEWIVPTSHPERVRECVVDQIKRHGKETEPYKWDILNIAVRVSTQADCTIERFEAAFAYQDLVGKVLLFAEPTEAMELPLAGFDGVIIRPSGYLKHGGGLALSVWDANLIDQCEAAGVLFHVLENE